jgi:hypothetical protein
MERKKRKEEGRKEGKKEGRKERNEKKKERDEGIVALGLWPFIYQHSLLHFFFFLLCQIVLSGQGTSAGDLSAGMATGQVP